uniref:Uncharacterized protein n=1 Tax=Glossina palpalis gambiensis TaxID=67801 RepID=A0A1B0BHE5_9MUSC
MKPCDNCSRFKDRGCCAEYLCYRYAHTKRWWHNTPAVTVITIKNQCYYNLYSHNVLSEQKDTLELIPQHNKIILKFPVLKVLKLMLYSFYHTACNTRIQVVAVTAFKIIPLIIMCGCPVNSFTSTLQGIRRICIT